MALEPPASVRVYRLLDPSISSGNADALAKALFGNAVGRGNGRFFRVSSASGFLSYQDEDALWSARAWSDLPAKPEAAEGIARRFFEMANARLANTSAFRKAGLARYFPEKLASAGNALATRPDTGAHWLCRFSVTLPTGIGQPDAAVTFALIEVRVGVGGRIGGLWSRWRPYVAEEDIARLDPPSLTGSSRSPSARSAAAASVSGQNGTTGDDPPPLVYLASDENVVQTLLMPYYVVTQEESALVAPASSYSLMVNIDQAADASGITLQAVVNGGSGSFNYSWARFSPAYVSTEGIQDLGDAAQVRVDVGHHNIVLLVRDDATGASFQTEVNVYA